MLTGVRPEPLPEPWTHPALVIGPSQIQGRGLFSAEDLPADTVVVRLGGRLVSTSELTSLMAAAETDPDVAYVDTITVYEDAHLVLPPVTLVHFGNHSCDPNMWVVGPYEMATRRDISAGEELTSDYGATSGAPGFAMACRCGTGLCRGEVTSDDWRLPELQARYQGHWVPALAERITRG